MNIPLGLQRGTWRAIILLWRNLCRLYTILRHPRIAERPELLLQYETLAQKAAYAGTCLHPRLDTSRQRRVQAIVPFRDKWSMTRIALKSLSCQQLTGINLLTVMSDNGSTDADTLAGLAEIQASDHPNISFRHLRHDMPFNFSRLNNLGVAACTDFVPDYLLFMNNDVELTDPNTIAAMVAFLETNPACGSVGCTLLYPNHRIQHLFIFIGCMYVGTHPFKGQPYDLNDPWMHSPRPVGASTAALLLVRTRDFIAVGGFDEALPSFQDVDLALKLQKQGLVNWVLPAISAIHHETQSRGHTLDWNEVAEVYSRWGNQLLWNPFISARFCRWSEQITLGLGEKAYPWWRLTGRYKSKQV